MARYPIFKEGDRVAIHSSIIKSVPSQTVIMHLTENHYRGFIRGRMGRRSGSAPLYSVRVGGIGYSIYANYLKKIK